VLLVLAGYLWWEEDGPGAAIAVARSPFR
jgi:hypothetical protein